MSSCRYIPYREDCMGYSRLLLSQENRSCPDAIHDPTRYERALSAALFGYDIKRERAVLPFRPRQHKTTVEAVMSEPSPSTSFKVSRISSNTLPGLCNDAYHNPLSLTHGYQAICGAKAELYFLDLVKGNGTVIHRRSDSEVISATLRLNPSTVATGSTKSVLSYVDTCNSAPIRELDLHSREIEVIDRLDEHVVLAGCENGTLARVDLREKEPSIFHSFSKKISSIAVGTLIAVGSDDDSIKVYDQRKLNKELSTLLGHQSAVTSLFWENSHHLVSSGGSYDRTIRLWCMNSNDKEFACVDTMSQVTSIIKLADRTFLSTHGFFSSNTDQIRLWSIKDQKIEHLKDIAADHEERLLFSSYRDGVLVTGSGKDQLINTWKIEN